MEYKDPMMNTILQKDVATWLGVKQATLSNYFCNNRRVNRKDAKSLSEKTGVSYEDIMLSDGKQIKKKFFLAYSLRDQK